MDTVLIAPDGTVAQTWSDNDWTTANMLSAVEKTAAQNK
jgi:hypothetical protein